MQQVFAIAVGGAFGCLCRYGANVACTRWLELSMIYSTLTVNIVGCFAFGLVAGSPWSDHPVITAAVAVGFLGGMTTFSSFGFETLRLFQTAPPTAALLNIAANVVLGIGGVFLGLSVAKAFAH